MFLVLYWREYCQNIRVHQSTNLLASEGNPRLIGQSEYEEELSNILERFSSCFSKNDFVLQSEKSEHDTS